MPPLFARYVVVRRTVVVFLMSCLWFFAAMAQAHEYALGDLQIDHPYSRAAPPTATVGAGYMTLKNQGHRSVRLLGVSVPFAEQVEIHLMTHKDGMMKMQKLEGGLEIPAGETVKLAPGGYHLMFINLQQPLKAGDKHQAVLEFDSGKVNVVFNVESIVGAEVGAKVDAMQPGSGQQAHPH